MLHLSAGTQYKITVTVNDRSRTGPAEPRLLLTDFLRHVLGLTGTRVGCEHGVCGACTIHLDGEPVRACLTLAVEADGRRIDTVEGLAGPDGRLSPLQQAFKSNHALQCGYCTPGILMSLDHHLRTHPETTEANIREVLSGHLCRCTGYAGIVRAALEAAGARSSAAQPDREG